MRIKGPGAKKYLTFGAHLPDRDAEALRQGSLDAPTASRVRVALHGGLIEGNGWSIEMLSTATVSELGG